MVRTTHGSHRGSMSKATATGELRHPMLPTSAFGGPDVSTMSGRSEGRVIALDNE